MLPYGKQPLIGAIDEMGRFWLLYIHTVTIAGIPMNRAEVVGRVSSSSIALPLYQCRVSAGFPSPADDYLETSLSLDDLVGVRAPSTFLVRSGGDSMIEEGIFDGDVLVVDKALDAVAGDVIIAVVRGEFTVKKLAFEPDGLPVLLPANPRYQPIRPRDGEDLEVWAVVTHNLHAFRR